MTDTLKSQIPPYMGWATWHRLLEGLKTFIPPHLDRSYYDSLGFSGTQRSQAVLALRYLKLTNEDRSPTEKLQLLINATDNEYKHIFREIIRHSYQPFFENPGPQNATMGDLEEYFKEVGASSGVVDKCITFFLKASKEAEIPLSPQLSRGLGRGAGRGASSLRRIASRQTSRATSSEKIRTQGEKLPAILAHSLLEKFPDFDPNWSEDLRIKWLESFQELLKKIS